MLKHNLRHSITKMKIRFHAFLDESGQREYNLQTDKYFVVAGAIVRISQRDVYETELNGLKRAYFGTTDVEIKSNWLRQPHECKKRILSLTESTKTNSPDLWTLLTNG